MQLNIDNKFDRRQEFGTL